MGGETYLPPQGRVEESEVDGWCRFHVKRAGSFGRQRGNSESPCGLTVAIRRPRKKSGGTGALGFGRYSASPPSPRGSVPRETGEPVAKPADQGVGGGNTSPPQGRAEESGGWRVVSVPCGTGWRLRLGNVESESLRGAPMYMGTDRRDTPPPERSPAGTGTPGTRPEVLS